MQDWQTCSTCNVQYKELDNLGTWQCRYHPMEYDNDVGYLCCKRKIRKRRSSSGTEWMTHTQPARTNRQIPLPKGCQTCDHKPGKRSDSPINLLNEKTLVETLIQSKYYSNESLTMPGFDAETMLIHRSATSKTASKTASTPSN